MTCGDAVYSPNVFNSVHNGVKEVDVPTDQNNAATLSQVGKCDSGFRGVKKSYYTNCFYHSDVDKEVVRGLIAKGNKARALTRANKQTIVTSRSFVRKDHTCGDHQLGGGVEMLNSNVSHVGGQLVSNEKANECVLEDKETSNNINQVSGPNVIESSNNTNESCGVTFINTNHLHECTGYGDTQTNALVCDTVSIYNINTDTDDKFLVSLLSRSVVKKVFLSDHDQCDAFQDWKRQTEFEFGFIPLTNLVLHQSTYIGPGFESPIEQHHTVKSYGVPNFLGARSPVNSQLNVSAWEECLVNYCDKQLIELMRFGFPLDFNREASLFCDMVNHTSAVQFPHDVDAYLAEEHFHDAILGPFKKSPIDKCHYSPFITREKSGSNLRRVIIDLSWPRDQSVNVGIDKNSYLNSEFVLQFPTVDHIVNQLKKVGRGCHLFKIDVSCAFRHIKVDPADYDLLGLHWDAHYVDTCLPFGSRHGTTFFESVRRVSHVMPMTPFTQFSKN